MTKQGLLLYLRQHYPRLSVEYTDDGQILIVRQLIKDGDSWLMVGLLPAEVISVDGFDKILATLVEIFTKQ